MSTYTIQQTLDYFTRFERFNLSEKVLRMERNTKRLLGIGIRLHREIGSKTCKNKKALDQKQVQNM